MNLQHLFKEINNLKEQVDEIYIYGFGSYGRNLYNILKRNSIRVHGFVVTSMSSDMDQHELFVCNAESTFDRKAGYILALSYRNAEEVKTYLRGNNINEKYIINAGEYIEQFGEKRGMRTGSIEITMVIGCKVNCRYCPQKMLLSKYYKDNPKRISIMDMTTFEKCLEIFPKDYDLSFGGMSEPFLNDSFIDMLKMACGKGRKVFLYTTLVGIKKEQVEEIISLPIQFVVLHVADKYNYARISKNEDYYFILEKFIKAKKKDGTPFVNMCNAQAEPDERVKRICKDKYEIFTEMTDRAGNLESSNLIHNKNLKGKISCGNMGVEMNNNILLPDGSVVLCCMDYGLKHILGNIYENTYEEIMNGEEMKKIKEGMNGNMDIDILCRNCSYARERK